MTDYKFIQLDEKEYLLAKELEEGNILAPAAQEQSTIRKIMSFISKILLIGTALLYLYNNLEGASHISAISACKVFFLQKVNLTPSPILEIFEIQTPLTEFSANSSQLIFNSSLSTELHGEYEVPIDFKFTDGYFTLNFTNFNSVDIINAAPVVVEISVDEFSIWRSSAPISKLNTITFSSTTKNISEYLSLFDQKRTISLNILEGDATGLAATLEFTLVNGTANTNIIPDIVPLLPSDLLSATGPASSVVSLNKKGKPFNVPSNKISVTLPQLSSNSTVAKLALLLSASKEELAYYKSDDTPLRYIEIFVNDIYLTSINPKPDLYHTEALAPNITEKLAPLVETGNFVGFTYEADLISILPLLWAGEATLEIFVVSPVDSSTPSIPGVEKPIIKGEHAITSENWFVSGNLLSWESENVIGSTGEINDFNASQESSVVVIKPPSVSPWAPRLTNEFIKDSISANMSSTLNFTLVDNSNLLYTINTKSAIKSVLSKQKKSSTKKIGPPTSSISLTEESMNLVSISNNKFSLEVLDSLSGTAIYTSKKVSSYPLSLSETVKTSPIAPDSYDLKSDLKIEFSESVNGIFVKDFKVKGKLASSPIVGVVADFKYTDNDYEREVEVVNGSIDKDIITTPGKAFNFL